MKRLPQMILIGSSGRNSGKTTLACEMIRESKGKYPLYGLKIISIDSERGKCQRGEEGCGICTSIKSGFELVPEQNPDSQKDTSLMLRSGAKKVFLLKALKTHLTEGLEAFLKELPEDAFVICESNTLRNFVVPGVFLFVQNTQSGAMKPSAKRVVEYSDMVISLPEKPFVPSLSFGVTEDGKPAVTTGRQPLSEMRQMKWMR